MQASSLFATEAVLANGRPPSTFFEAETIMKKLIQDGRFWGWADPTRGELLAGIKRSR